MAKRPFVPYARPKVGQWYGPDPPPGQKVWLVTVSRGGACYWGVGSQGSDTFTILTGSRLDLASATVTERLHPVMVRAIRAAGG